VHRNEASGKASLADEMLCAFPLRGGGFAFAVLSDPAPGNQVLRVGDHQLDAADPIGFLDLPVRQLQRGR
jgi:hypothetical protein